METINRKQFFEELIATQVNQVAPAGEDEIFKRYANKQLPKAAKTTAYLDQYNGAWSEKEAIHLLRRTMFGVKDADVQYLLTFNFSDAVDYLLDNIPAAPSPPLNNYTQAGDTDTTGVPFGATWVTANFGDGTLNDIRKKTYKAWWLGVMINQNLSIQEKMVFFWHNHFATQSAVNGDARMCYVHNVLLRTNALSNFKELVKLVTKDPCMLLYLNGNDNIGTRPDENYGRELQELFTLGKNNVPNYSEDDVKAAARVLTGWRVNTFTLESFFVPAAHDATDKQFSAFYGNAIITGESGANGADETDNLLDMICSKFETAHYICTKLYRFFVYYNIDAAIDDNVIKPLAQMLMDNDYELKPVMRTLFKSQHFYDTLNMGCAIKTPLDFLVGVFRTFGVAMPPAADITDTYAVWAYMRKYGADLGLDLGDPPNVSGWQAYYQVPVYYEMWINSSTYPLRLEFSDMMLSSGFNAGTTTTLSIDVVGFVNQYSNPSDPDALIGHCSSLLLGIELSAGVIAGLKNILLSGQTNNNYWTDAWNSYVSNPDLGNTSIVKSRLSSFFVALLRLAEFQLC